MKRIKNCILKSITVLMTLVFILSVCAADSEGYIQYICIAVSLAWFVLFFYANGFFYGGDKE